MKFTVVKPVEIEVTKIVISIAPRYIGDSEDDDIPTDFPLLSANKDSWEATVMIGSGQILDWPEGEEREMYAKVCDAGHYILLGSDGEKHGEIFGYVPHGVVPGEYGDYIHLVIGGDGVIKNWPKTPDISEFFEQQD